jgi:hypothetical protein
METSSKLTKKAVGVTLYSNHLSNGNIFGVNGGFLPVNGNSIPG